MATIGNTLLAIGLAVMATAPLLPDSTTYSPRWAALVLAFFLNTLGTALIAQRQRTRATATAEVATEQGVTNADQDRREDMQGKV
jgi:uncharacterized membrane protein YczE